MGDLKLRKKYFKFARDIPYRIYLSPDEPDYCCTGKHWLLKKLLESTGLKVRYKVCEFSWSENLKLPEKVKSKAHDDMCTHTCLEVFIPERKEWAVIDATNDTGLEPTLRVNDWDGINNTEVWCRPINIYSAEKSEELVNSYMDKKSIETDLKKHKDFYKAINEWFESIRRKN